MRTPYVFPERLGPRVTFPWLALSLLVLSLFAPLLVLPFAHEAPREPTAIASPSGADSERLAAERTVQRLVGSQASSPTLGSAVPLVAWQDLTSTAGPPPSLRVGAAMAYDAADSSVILFGGEDPGGSLFHDDTWKFVGGVWTNITASVGAPPPARVSASMVYDAADGYLLMFGGLAVTGGGYWLEDYSDTWKFSGGVWSNITASAGAPPSGRFSMGLTYDWSSHQVFGFGGEDAAINGLSGSVTIYGGTWAFSGGTWRSLTGTTGTAPSPRAGPNMVYDAADGYVLLYGGIWESLSGTTLSGFEMADTWAFISGTWSNRTALVTGAPGDLALSGMAYDATSRSVIMFGGCTPPISQSCPVVNTTWSYVGGTWTDVSPWIAQAPPPRATMAMTNDSADGYLVLFGGSCGSGCATADTWIEDGHGTNVFPLTFVASPATCGPIVFDGTPWASGASGSFATGPGTVSVSPCPGDVFAGWNVSGGLGLASTTALSTTDHLWGTATLTAWFVPDLTSSAAASSPTVGLGASDTLTATPSGGFGPYSAEWTLNGTNSSVKLNPWSVTYAHAGNYTYTAWITDALGSLAQSPAFRVRVLPYTPPPLALNLSLTSYYAPTGSSLTGTATVSGGTISSYAWTENVTQLLATCTGPSCPIAFPHGGRYGVSVSVLDNLGRTATEATNVTIWTYVSSTPPPPLQVLLKANVTTLYVGEPVTLNLTPAGGIPPYHGYVLWVNGTGNSSPFASRQFQFSFAGAATYRLQAWAFDSAGNVAASNFLTITVQPVPQPPPGGPSAFASGPFGIPWIVLLVVPVVVIALVVIVIVRRRRPRPPSPEAVTSSSAYGYPGGEPVDPGWGGQGYAPDPYGQPGAGYDVAPGAPPAGPYAPPPRR